MSKPKRRVIRRNGVFYPEKRHWLWGWEPVRENKHHEPIGFDELQDALNAFEDEAVLNEVVWTD